MQTKYVQTPQPGIKSIASRTFSRLAEKARGGREKWEKGEQTGRERGRFLAALSFTPSWMSASIALFRIVTANSSSPLRFGAPSSVNEWLRLLHHRTPKNHPPCMGCEGFLISNLFLA